MSIDWKPGDRAMCIKQINWKTVWGDHSSGPNKGEVNEVTNVKGFVSPFTGEPILGLYFERRYVGKSYVDEFFIKLDPYSEDEDDREVIDLYKNNKVPELIE